MAARWTAADVARTPARAEDVRGLDRSDRAGEYPTEAPPRPQGPERNVVITQWDWADPREYFHDVIASDKRNPTVNAERSGVRTARELVAIT